MKNKFLDKNFFENILESNEKFEIENNTSRKFDILNKFSLDDEFPTKYVLKSKFSQINYNLNFNNIKHDKTESNLKNKKRFLKTVKYFTFIIN